MARQASCILGPLVPDPCGVGQGSWGWRGCPILQAAGVSLGHQGLWGLQALTHEISLSSFMARVHGVLWPVELP